MRQHASELQALALLGISGYITDHVLFVSVEFISLLYGMKSTSLNELHCFKSEKG